MKNRAGFLAVVGLILAASSTTRADFAYIGYYHSKEVIQLTLTNNGTSETITPMTGATIIASGYAPEMILNFTGLPSTSPGGVSNQLFVVDTSNGTVLAYNSQTGAVLNGGNNILSTSSGTPLVLGGSVAGATIGPSGQNFYVAQSSAGNVVSGIYEFSAATGKEVGYTSALNLVHDVTYHNGYLYASAYQSSSQTGIYQINPNLPANGSGVTLTPYVTATNGTGTPTSGPTTTAFSATANQLYEATGMTFVTVAGQTYMYVGNAAINSSNSNAQSFVQEYNVTSGSAVYVQTFTSQTMIINPFGLSTGPDGNIYVSSLGTLTSQGNGTVTNANGQITEINATTGAISTFLADDYSAYGATTGEAPKYLSFNANAVVFVPEPGSIIMTGIGLAGLAFVGRIKRQRPAHSTIEAEPTSL
jgi:hypothetical protein